MVTATISQGDLSTLATLTGTGNAYTVTLSDTTAAASALTTLDSKTTVAVNAGSVTTLSGTAAEVTAAYSANTAGSISGLGDEAVSLSDTTLAATALNAVNSYTTGVVNAGSVTTLTGLLVDVNTAYAANAANTISGLGDEAVTIINTTGTLQASDLSTAGNATTGTVTVSNAQTVSGTPAEVTAALVTSATKVVMGAASTATISAATDAATGAAIATTSNVTATFSAGIVDSLANLASGGAATANLTSITTDHPAVVLTINNAGGGTMAAADLSAVGNASTGTVTVTNAQTVNGTADEVIAAVVTTASKVNLNTGSTINASTYNTQDLSGVDAAFTLNITTINGAVLDATKLATADSVTLVGTNTATAASADVLGSRLIGTATLNITSDPITANTNLSALGSGLTLQFGGDSTVVVNGATLSVRQNQVSGYTISGTGTVSAAGTTSADTFDASGISATTNYTSLAGNDSISIAPSTLGSGDSIDGGADTDTLIFSAPTTSIVDASFTNVTNTEVLQLAAGTNTITLGSEAENSGAGITTVTGGTGADSLNLLYGTTGLTFNAGSGPDTLSYSADSATQSITLTSVSSGTASGSVSNGGTDTFTGLEAIVGGSGNSDLINSTIAAETLLVSGANAGTIDGFAFSGVESVNLGLGNDNATVNSGGSLSGNLDLGDGNNTLTFNSGAGSVGSVTTGTGTDSVTISGGSISSALALGTGADSLSYAGYASGVSATLSGTNALSTTSTAIGGGVSGVENITLSSNNDTFTVANAGTLSGNLDLGSGSDTLSYSGYSSAVTVSFNSATSTAAGGATGISGTTVGFESLIGGSGSDSLNANAGVNSLNVASNGTTTLDTSLTVSGFETINLGANSDASNDTTTISGAFSGTIDLGAGNDNATINNGGSATSLVGGAGTDTLNLDGAANSITVTGSGAGTTAGTTGGSTTFSGFETVNGQAGTDSFTLNNASTSTISLDGGADTDSLSVAGSDSGANSLTISGTGSGSLGNVSFSAMESITLGSGGDTATINSGGSLSGNLDLGGGNNTLTFNSGAGAIGSVTAGTGNDSVTVSGGSITGALTLGSGTDSLSYAGYGSAVAVTLSGGNALSSTSAIGGGVSGVEHVTLSSNNDTFTVANAGTLSGNLDLGSGSDTLSYSGYSSAVTVSFNSATSTAAGGATGISGTTVGFESLIGGSGSDSLTTSTADNVLVLTGSNEGTLDSTLNFSAFESVDLANGNDSVQFTSGDSLSGTLAGGNGTDTLDYSGYGSAVNVNLASGTATGTGAISGFDTVLGSASGDTITASTSGDVNLQGNGGNDTLRFTVYGLTSTDSVDGGGGSDTLVISDAGTISDAQFTNVTLLESVTLTGASTLTAGTEASQAGIAIVTTGSGNTTVNTSLNGYDLTLEAASLGDGASLTLTGSASSNDFTVNNITGSVLASGTSGSLTINAGDASDNAIGVSTGSGNTTITGSGASDTITVNADAMADNTTLDINGSDTYTVSNLEANTDAAGTTGSVSLAFGDVTDNAATIITGSGATTISGSSSGDTLTTNATNLPQNTLLTLFGAAKQVVTNLIGNLTGSSLTGTLDVSTGDAADNGISITTGTAATSITGSASSDTINTDAAALAQNTSLTLSGSSKEVVTNLVGDISATALTGSLNVTTSDAADNGIGITTGSAATTVVGSAATDTINTNAAALVQNTTLTLSGSSKEVVTNLVGDVSATALTGTLNITTADAADNGISIATGSAATTIAGTASSDTINTDAAALAQNTTLTLSGNSKEVVTNLVGDINATGLSGTLTVTTGNAADLSISISSGSGDTTINASGTGSGNGNALNFDGSNDYATIPKSISNDFTIEFWIKTSETSPTGGQWYSGKGIVDAEVPGGTTDFGTSLLNNKIAFGVGQSDTTIQSQSSINTGSWTHVAVTRNSSSGSMQIYINGTLEASGTGPTGSRSAPNAIAIGSLLNGGGYLNASIDELRLWNTVRTQSDIQAAMNTALAPQSGLVAYYTFNQGSPAGSNAGLSSLTDLSGNGNTGTLYNMALSGSSSNWVAGVVADQIPGAIQLNADQMLDNTNLILTGSNSFTVTNLEANLDASGTSGSLTVNTSNIIDNAASLKAGTGNVVVNGGDATDTITVTGLSTNNQTFSAQSSTSNFNITAGANDQTISGSNTGSDTIAGGAGTDTLSYAGGSNVNVTITSYGNQAGGSSGQGTDTFTGFESLVGATGNDTLRGTASGTDEVATITGANSGSLRDSGSSGTFNFSSFEQIDLQGGNDTVLFNSNAASLAANVDLGAGTGDTLSYGGYSNTVSVSLNDITANSGTTTSGGATAIGGTASGFESLVGGSSSGDTLIDSTGDSSVSVTGANSGTIDGLTFSAFENLNLSTGNDTVTVNGSGSTVSLTGSLDLGDGTNSLTMNGSAGSIASVSSGTGDDTVSISAGLVTGAVTAGNGTNSLTISGTNSRVGSYTSGTGGDSVTLSGGDVVGNVSTGTGSDTVLISSTSSTIGGSLDLGTGDADTLSYAGYSNAVSVTLTGISSNSGSTGAGGATAITGSAAGFENLVGGSNSGDTLTDSTGDSTIVINGANSGTIDGMTFSSIENLSLSTGIDGVTVQSGGSLSGNLNLGDGTSNTLVMNSGAGAIGSVTAAGGNDTITMNGGTVTGAVNVGDGANALTINDTNSSIGSYTGGSGIDTIESKGGDILGTVSTGSAADSVTLSLGATITGAVTLGASSDGSDGNDSLTLNASSITGAVNTGSAADTVSLSNASLITGDVSLGSNSDTTDGNDSLSLNASTITGNVNTGSGADSVSVLNTSTVTGNVTLGTTTDSADGADSLTVTGTSSSSKSVITGSIATGGGADSLDFTNATIGGAGQTISLGSDNNGLDGNDSLTASGTAITAAITTGSGADTLTLSASSSLTGNVSLGIDGDTPTISDSFDSLNGWNGGTLETSSSYYGSFLGRYSNGAKTNGQDVSKTFALNSQPATISFDFIRLDSWDSENFRAYINDYVAFTGNFRFDQAIGSSSGITNGFNWTIAPKDSSGSRGFASWNDQTATITLSLPAGYSSVKLGFGSDLNSDANDESYGIDNLSITPSNVSSNDTLTLNASTLTGNVTTGSGADAVSVLTGSKITGSLNLGSNTDTKDSGDTLTVTGVPSGTNSEITGSITTGGGADTLTLTDATIGGAGQTISLGSDNNSNDGNDALSASGTAITAAITTGSGSDSISLSVGSSVLGNVTLGSDGDTTNGNADTLTLNASTITGNVVTGSGADGVSVLNTSTITGTVTLGTNSDSADSGDTLTVTGADTTSKSVVTGSISTGAGADVVSFTNATIGGSSQTIALGSNSNSLDGNDSLTANGTAITATITTGSGGDTVTLLASSTVSGNVTLGIDGDTNTGNNSDTLTLNASSITGNVSTGSGADSVSVVNASTISGNVTLGSNSDGHDGADSLTVTGADSSNKSEITGSISTGAGADVVSFTNATIGGAGQTISLGTDTNGLEGNDSLTASGTSITATITTGSGSDTLSLSAGSSVTGDVTLGSVGDNQDSTVNDSFNSASGWTNGSVDSTNSYYGSFLGRYAAGTRSSGQDVYKSFSFSYSPATISFDFIKLDSWDGESFSAYINDTVAFSGSFLAGSAISSGSGTTNGFSWTIAPKDSLAGYGFGGWSDQTATITITPPTGYSNFNKLGFGSTLNQDISDESYGIDNLTIIPTIVSHDDSLSLDASSITGNVTTGSAADTLRVLNASTITGNVTLGSNTDSTDGADTLMVTGASSSSKSEISGSITTGAGADTLTLTNATIGGSTQTLSLGSDNNSLDGNDTLTANGTAITATVTTGSGADSVTLSNGSSIAGNVTLGIAGDTTNGNGDTLTLNASSITGNVVMGSGADSVTLTNGSSITGTVSLGSDGDSTDGNDTLNLGSGNVRITGDVGLGYGSGDLVTYQGHAESITFTVSSIRADSIGTGSSTANRAALISGTASGYETLNGADAVGANLSTGDVLIDDTGASLAILNSTGAGTLDNLDFSAFESLRLGSGNDTLRFEGASVPGALAGRADGGGIEGATYSYGTLTGGAYTDTGTDLLDYTAYLAGSVTVDLSQNRSTGIYGGQAGGLINASGAEGVTSTSDSSFENVYGSSFNDSISGDNQANLLRGYGGNDTILGLAGDDTIDGGDNTSGPDGADVIAAGDGADLILGSDGSDFISGGGYTAEGSTYTAVADTSIDTLSYIDENEGLDVSLTGTDTGTVLADAAASLSISTFTNTYSSSGAQTISVPTNQVGSSDWADTYGDIQRLVLTNQNDILRVDSTDFISASQPTGPGGSFSVDAGGGSLDTLDYSSFASNKPVYVNLSGTDEGFSNGFSFDFDANGTIDLTVGEIKLANSYSATNINGSGTGNTSGTFSPAAVGGSYGVTNFEVVIGGAADDAIVGNNSANILVGNEGADRIAGLGGNDTIYGGKGDDYIIPGDGTDYVNAGQGINTILITSNDFSERDVFAVDPNGINIFKLNGDGTSGNTSQISAPGGDWNPGALGIDLLDGGDPIPQSGQTIYDTIIGTANDDNYQFGSTAFKNIQSVDLGAGNDSVGTAPTSKGVKVNYDGNSGTDSITLTLTFRQFANLNQSGNYVADIQNYIDAPTGKTFSSNQADFTATNFEAGGVQVIVPGVYNALQGDPAAVTFNSSFGLRGVTSTSGADQDLSATATAISSANASSVGDLVSAFVQANLVKGADAVAILSGSDLSGSATADQVANASATTVNDRSDAVLSAYGLGVDRSALTAGGDIALRLSGTVKADTVGEAVDGVVNASGTTEAAGSRDTTLTAGNALSLNAAGTANQTVSAGVIEGLAVAGLASRTYGIDDANLTDTAADSLQAGGNLGLTARASGTSTVNANGVGTLALGPITLENNGAASTDRFTLPSSLWGTAFPLINGDRVRFTASNSSVQADRDYYVLNVIPITGEFQLSSTPAGDPIDVAAADTLQGFRPALSTADAISTATAVDLNRSGVGVGGLQAGQSLNVDASASDAVRATATNVAGDASAGLNRLGGLDNLNTQPVSSVVALSTTASFSGSDAAIRGLAGESSTLQASTTAGDALAEGNVQVLGSDTSATTAGGALRLQASANLSESAQASSVDGRAEARSGAGAGAGSSTGNGTGAIGNALPAASTYGLSTGLNDGSQSAGTDLSVTATGTLTLNASASTAGGSRSLGSLWSNASNVLSTFDPTASTPSLIGPQFLADGQRVVLDATNAGNLGLTADKDYVVRLLASESVDATGNTITMPTGITYANGDAIRFRLNSTTPANSSTTRYGLELGTTYYVKGGGSSFQLATAPGGPAIDLLPDSVGLADQLVDADRFQLLVPPTTPTGTYSVATLTGGRSGLTLQLPAEATAFAGSRQAGISLVDPDTLNLAQVNGIDGSGLASGSGLLSLLAGKLATINAAADGVISALARNIAGDASASAGLVAEGLNNAALTAGGDGTVAARATINAIADASSTGNSSATDNSLSTLNLAARAIEAGKADQDISLGANGTISADAAIDGRSSASLISGNADALATLEVSGLQASNAGFAVTIGDAGDLAASARLGSTASPLLISALSSGVGNATAQGASSVEGILGTYDATAGFSQLRTGDQASISSVATDNLQLTAAATNGAARASLGDISGTGTANVIGIRDMAITVGAGLAEITSTATGVANLSAMSVTGDASANGSTSTAGILSDTPSVQLGITAGNQGEIAALASQKSVASATSVSGQASSNLSNSSVALQSVQLTLAGTAQIRAEALTELLSRSQSVSSNASA